MKRRSSNDPDREQAEREAMAELQKMTSGAGGRPAPTQGRSRRSGSSDRPRAWGDSGSEPAWKPSYQPGSEPEPDDFEAVPEREPEPQWRPTSRYTPPAPVRGGPPPAPWEQGGAEYEVGLEDEEWDDEDEWEEVEEGADTWDQPDDRGDRGDRGNRPIGLVGIPLDFDATDIALDQLAQRSNIRGAATSYSGIDAGEAEMIRDRAMAQFLEKQQARAREDAERAARSDKPKRPAFPPLSPGLSAKSLVMQPVTAPPLHRPGAASNTNVPGATTIAPGLLAAHARADREAAAEAREAKRRRSDEAGAAPETAGPKKAAAKKAVTKKALTKKAGAQPEASAAKKAVKKAAKKVAEAPAKAAAPVRSSTASARTAKVASKTAETATKTTPKTAKATKPASGAGPAPAAKAKEPAAKAAKAAAVKVSTRTRSARTPAKPAPDPTPQAKEPVTKKAVTKKAGVPASSAAAAAEAPKPAATTRKVVSTRGRAPRR